MSGEVIDLLSSDDDIRPDLSHPPAGPITNSGLGARKYTNPYSVAVYPQPAKRRKLSSSPEIDAVSSTPRCTSADGLAIEAPNHSMRLPDRHSSTRNETTDDPIFTSSAHVDALVSAVVKNAVPVMSLDCDGSDDSLPDDPLLNLTKMTKASRQVLASTTASKARQNVSAYNSAKGPFDLRESDDDSERLSRAPKPTKAPKVTAEERLKRAKDKEREKIAKALEKSRQKEQKTKEKEDELERKKQEKDRKARDKRVAAELAEVNRAKLDKKDSTKEMIVDLPASIAGQSVETQTRAFLEKLEVEASLYESSVPNVVRWRRKVKAQWNSQMGYWEPLTRMRIENEKHVLCILPAKEFASLAAGQSPEQDLETHVAKLKSAYDGCTPIYLIEGLSVLLRKSKTAENRNFQAQVLRQSQENNASSEAKGRKQKAAPMIIDEEVIEDALMQLQVMHDCLVHHTSIAVETAEWIATFTQHISTIPYRLQRLNLETSFCMDSGQVKTGEDRDDTFIHMLQEVVRVTPAAAYGIASHYPSALSLTKAFRKGGPLILAELLKSANRNGALTDRKIGPAVSRRLYRVFMEGDPECTDI